MSINWNFKVAVLSSELWDMRVFMIYFNLVPRVSRSRGREKETAWKRNWLFPLSHVTGMESRFYSPLQLRISRNTLCLYPRPLPTKKKCCVSMVFNFSWVDCSNILKLKFARKVSYNLSMPPWHARNLSSPNHILNILSIYASKYMLPMFYFVIWYSILIFHLWGFLKQNAFVKALK